MRAFKWCSWLLLIPLSACAPPPEYRTLDGDSGAFSDLHGTWVVINYWAIWCKPCIEEIPELNAFAAANGERVRVLGVNFDQPALDRLGADAERLGIEFEVLLDDPAPLLSLPRPPGLPATFIINPQGELAHQLHGPQTREQLEALVSPRPGP